METWLPISITDPFAVTGKPCPNKIHVSRDESVAESLCVIGDFRNWQRYRYIPGAWDRVKNDVVVDPAETASRLHKAHPRAKGLLVIREQAGYNLCGRNGYNYLFVRRDIYRTP